MPLRDQLQAIFNLTPSQRLGSGLRFNAYFDNSLSTVTPYEGRREILAKLFRKERGSSGLKFPENIDSAKYYMRFDFAPYQRTQAFSVDVLAWEQKIYLPMPENISDAYSMTYDTTDLGPIFGASLTDSAGKFVGFSETGKQLGAIAADKGGDVVEAVTGRGATERFGQESGFIVNPHSSVVFRGIQLKSHTFSWKLAPKNENETQNLKEIIHEFKVNFLPRQYSGGWMGYPNLCAPHYLVDGNENEFFPIFDPVGTPTAITNFSVSYTPDGGSSFLRNGSPVAVIMNLEIREMEVKYVDAEGVVRGGQSQLPGAGDND